MKNVLFSGNDKVFDGMLSCILSIMKRSEDKDDFCFYLMTMDITRVDEKYKPISEKDRIFLQSVVDSYGSNNKVVLLDVTDIYEKEFGHCPNESAYCSPYTLLRLLADLVPDMPDKLLYLDVDVLFNKDFDLLYDIDVEGYEYAAARDHYGKFLLRPDYINAGVLLFNMKYMKETGLLRKARELIKTKKLTFADQSAIFLRTTKKKLISQRYNDQKFLYKKTVVRHFSKRLFYLPYPHTDNIKQWHVDKMKKVFKYTEFDDVLEEYEDLRNKHIS